MKLKSQKGMKRARNVLDRKRKKRANSRKKLTGK